MLTHPPVPQRCHWRRKLGAGDPCQVPSVAVSVAPKVCAPVTTGTRTFAGGTSSIRTSAARSDAVTVSRYFHLIRIQRTAYPNQSARRGGFQRSGASAPFSPSTRRLITTSPATSLAYRVRRTRVQCRAPLRQAFASGTSWSTASWPGPRRIAPV